MIFPQKKIEEIETMNLFFKKRIKKIINSNMDSNSKNVTNDFSEYSENCIIGNEYYENFLNLLNKSENDYPEDIEISIYDNLKSNNNARESSLSIINEIINEFVNDDESKKGFIALLKQSFLIGKLRSNIVSINYINIFIL